MISNQILFKYQYCKDKKRSPKKSWYILNNIQSTKIPNISGIKKNYLLLSFIQQTAVVVPWSSNKSDKKRSLLRHGACYMYKNNLRTLSNREAKLP